MYQSSRFNDEKKAFSGNKKHIIFPYFMTCKHKCMCVYGHYAPAMGKCPGKPSSN